MRTGTWCAIDVFTRVVCLKVSCLLCADRRVQANTTEAEVQSAFHLLNADGSGRVNLTQWQEFYLQVT